MGWFLVGMDPSHFASPRHGGRGRRRDNPCELGTRTKRLSVPCVGLQAERELHRSGTFADIRFDQQKKWGPWDPKNDVLYCMRALRLVICAGESDNEKETAPEPQADLIPAQWRDSLITRSGAGAREANPCGVQDGKVT
jgi:hypothetical protein